MCQGNDQRREAFYTHQQIELPQIDLDVTHYVLHCGCCSRCGKTVSAKLSREQRAGYGPRMSALIAELSGMQGISRKGVQRFLLLLMAHDAEQNEAGKLARSLAAEMDSLWVFLDENGVEQTNNRAERALRFCVIWRKRCFGCQSDKGARWVERILSLKETCRLKGMASFPVIVDLVQAYFKEQQPNLAWIG